MRLYDRYGSVNFSGEQMIRKLLLTALYSNNCDLLRRALQNILKILKDKVKGSSTFLKIFGSEHPLALVSLNIHPALTYLVAFKMAKFNKSLAKREILSLMELINIKKLVEFRMDASDFEPAINLVEALLAALTRILFQLGERVEERVIRFLEPPYLARVAFMDISSKLDRRKLFNAFARRAKRKEFREFHEMPFFSFLEFFCQTIKTQQDYDLFIDIMEKAISQGEVYDMETLIDTIRALSFYAKEMGFKTECRGLFSCLVLLSVLVTYNDSSALEKLVACLKARKSLRQKILVFLLGHAKLGLEFLQMILGATLYVVERCYNEPITALNEAIDFASNIYMMFSTSLTFFKPRFLTYGILRAAVADDKLYEIIADKSVKELLDNPILLLVRLLRAGVKNSTIYRIVKEFPYEDAYESFYYSLEILGFLGLPKFQIAKTPKYLLAFLSLGAAIALGDDVLADQLIECIVSSKAYKWLCNAVLGAISDFVEDMDLEDIVLKALSEKDKKVLLSLSRLAYLILKAKKDAGYHVRLTMCKLSQFLNEETKQLFLKEVLKILIDSKAVSLMLKGLKDIPAAVKDELLLYIAANSESAEIPDIKILEILNRKATLELALSTNKRILKNILRLYAMKARISPISIGNFSIEASSELFAKTSEILLEEVDDPELYRGTIRFLREFILRYGPHIRQTMHIFSSSQSYEALKSIFKYWLEIAALKPNPKVASSVLSKTAYFPTIIFDDESMKNIRKLIKTVLLLWKARDWWRARGDGKHLLAWPEIAVEVLNELLNSKRATIEHLRHHLMYLVFAINDEKLIDEIIRSFILPSSQRNSATLKD